MSHSSDEAREAPEWAVPDTVDEPQWREKRKLASAVRRLVHALVPSEADAEMLKSLSAEIEAIAERIEKEPSKSNRDAFRDGTFLDRAQYFKDRTAMLGHQNPIAGPLRLDREGDKVIGTITCGPAYVGAPGLVHGGLVATFLDEVLGHACMAAGAGVVTSRFELHYIKPTPLSVPLRLEGWIERREGRRFHVVGQCIADSVVTVKARGTFVDVHGERFVDLFRKLHGPGNRAGEADTEGAG